MNIAEEEFNSVSKEEWAALCMHVKKIEKEYLNWNQ
jgi:hypothetical protein